MIALVDLLTKNSRWAVSRTCRTLWIRGLSSVTRCVSHAGDDLETGICDCGSNNHNQRKSTPGRAKICPDLHPPPGCSSCLGPLRPRGPRARLAWRASFAMPTCLCWSRSGSLVRSSGPRPCVSVCNADRRGTGLINNVLYVIILSAAQDLVGNVPKGKLCETTQRSKPNLESFLSRANLSLIHI